MTSPAQAQRVFSPAYAQQVDLTVPEWAMIALASASSNA
jgi:hypothetical protein